MASETTHDRRLRVAAVADRLGVTKAAVYPLIRSGDLDTIRVGRDYRISEASLEAYIERQTVRPTP